MIRVRDLRVLVIFILLISFIPVGISSIDTIEQVSQIPESHSNRNLSDTYDDFSHGDFSGVNLSQLTLHLILDEASASINGTLLIDYFNDAPISISSIPFHLYTSGMQYVDRSERGINIENVTAIGSSPAVTDFEVLSDQQLMWVNLESAIQPNEYASLNFTFQTLMPDGQDRSGFFGNNSDETLVYTFADSYPMPCVYDEYDGWNIDPYIDVGDPFYFKMAFYDVHIDVPEGMMVAATGVIDTINTENGRSVYHYEIPLPVREVTFSASRYYHVESTIYNGVNVSAFFLPISAELWESNALVIAVQSLTLFNSTYGIYPYSTLNVVEQHAFYAGMEYPCQVYVTHVISQQIIQGTRDAGWFELAIAHEVAHQWWSQLVGDNCVDWGFLDEGLTSWSHAYYGEIYHDDWEYFQSPRYLDIVRTFNTQYSVGSIINQSNLDRPDLTSYVDYTQTPVILEKLRHTVGHDEFIASLKAFFEEYYFGIATLNDLQASFEEVVGQDLDWFFKPWFGNGYLPSYAIENAVFDPTTLVLTFGIIDLSENQNQYDYSQQIPLRILGSQDTILIDTTVWVNGTTSFMFELTESPISITLDYNDFVLVQLPDDTTTSYTVSGAAITTLLPVGLDVIFVGVVFLISGILLVLVFLIERIRKS